MIEKKMVSQVGKATGGFINAMLKPKVDRVAKWAQDKDLLNYINSTDLQIRINKYVEKLAIRVSQMTSVIFPRETLNLKDFYEPIILLEYKKNSKYDLIKKIKKFEMNYLIVDSAGMGKSTFSKYLTSEILFKHDRVPIFFELRKTKGNLIDELASELDLLGDKFDRVVFKKLLYSGKFVIILDGFDEVSLSLQQEIAKNINDLTLKGGENSVIVTSREQDLLPELLNCKPLQFAPLNLIQIQSILYKIDKYTNLKVGHELIDMFSSIPEHFLETPLSITLLYQTYGINYSISKSKGTFYQRLFDALYDGHDLKNKNGYIREKKSNLDSEVFQKILRTLCYSMTVKNKVSFDNYVDATFHINESIKRARIENVSADKFLDDLLIAVPLLIRDGQEIKFFHKTIMEYFSSQFLIYHPERVNRINHIINNVKSNNFDSVIDFIYYSNEDLYHSIFTKKLVKFLSKLDLECSPVERKYRVISAMGEIKIAIVNSKEKLDDVIDDAINKSNELYHTHLIDYHGVDFKFYLNSIISVSVKSIFYSPYYRQAMMEVSSHYTNDVSFEEHSNISFVVRDIVECSLGKPFHIISSSDTDVSKYYDALMRKVMPKNIDQIIENKLEVNFDNEELVETFTSISIGKLNKFKKQLLFDNVLDVEYDDFF